MYRVLLTVFKRQFIMPIVRVTVTQKPDHATCLYIHLFTHTNVYIGVYGPQLEPFLSTSARQQPFS